MTLLSRLLAIGTGVGMALGIMLTLFFVSGGWIYHSQCTLRNGRTTTGWDLTESFVPYLYEVKTLHPGCDSKALPLYVASQLGIG
jgi:hypothetical protein